MYNEIRERIFKNKRELEKIPEGRYINNKYFPPSITYLDKLVDEIVYCLNQIYRLDNTVISINQIENLRSIQQNEISRAKVDEKIINEEYDINKYSYFVENIVSDILSCITIK